MSAPPVIVVGGGLAGITAALGLADAGREVTLLEARPRLGGRATSGRRRGQPVDTGVHVVLRCYEHYLALLDRLGVTPLIALQDRLDIEVLLPRGERAHLTRSHRGPPPLHLLAALLRYDALPGPARLSALRAAAALRHLDPDDPAVDLDAFGTWLRRHGQDPSTTEGLWGLVTTAALNLAPDEASLALAARVFRTGLLDRVDAGDIGIPTVPLSLLHEAPPRSALLAAGARVRLGSKVVRIERRARGLVVAVRDRHQQVTELPAEAVVLAVPHDHAAQLVPAGAVDDPAGWQALGHSPIVNVHVVFDRAVLPVPFAAVPGSAVQWVFDRTAASGRAAGGEQYLVSSVSAADDALHERTEDLVRVHLAELARHLPGLEHAHVLEAFVTREPHATFRQRPGTGRLRPGPTTHWPDLALAGAWTVPGWPDTLEAAVRSGRAAAARLLSVPMTATEHGDAGVSAPARAQMEVTS
ncbi:phytoene dehydrogenase [Intrasporangium chromatireducens Q5-1]|uniref:Phytoene dehydrogenase n=1 Tax=Intrasporangium chromatireducens Q5-1 TaxID=584657 RepID=W9GST8_9MICO|nr:hydroxysqualene dehydroxylase HpnE [Intrasporangium chromatireducens]EWT07893.1 phytoene dehydrogenase [Intrasporangium chromatireducens Q5-1]